MWRYGIPLLIAAVLGAFFLRGLSLSPGEIESPLIGEPAPAFTLPALQNPTQTVGTGDFAGEFTILNVWATWCVGCRQEHAFLLELARSGVPIYGLNWKDEHVEAMSWLSQLGNPYVAIAVDDVGDVAIDYGVYGAPETFLIGPDGTILEKHLGPMTPDIWDSLFVPMMTANGKAD